MKTKILFSLAITAIVASTLIVACTKSNSASAPAGAQNVSLLLTDAPGFYNNVYLDVKSVEVLVDTSTNTRKHDGCDWDRIGGGGPKPDSSLIWESLNVSAAVYDLLKLQNGVDTLFATATIPVGSIRLIKIDLGTNNSIVKDSVTYNLQLPPGAPSYVLVKLNGNEFEHYAANASRLWLDFNVQRSILQVGTTFYLNPFLTAFVVSQSGTVAGSVAPSAAWPEIVTVYGPNDTAYAFVNRNNGNFKIRGLKDGTYSANFHASNGYLDSTITNITISNANTVNVGTITLHK